MDIPLEHDEALVAADARCFDWAQTFGEEEGDPFMAQVVPVQIAYFEAREGFLPDHGDGVLRAPEQSAIDAAGHGLEDGHGLRGKGDFMWHAFVRALVVGAGS